MRLEKVVEGCPETILVYWTDCYTRTFDASLVRSVRDRGSDVYVVLDRTVFHPKGGGQPSDRGVLSGSEWRFEVKKAMF
ncbi:MAG: alanine--tRNA ligase-related protein, partial [Nitrososphaeria archaeon]